MREKSGSKGLRTQVTGVAASMNNPGVTQATTLFTKTYSGLTNEQGLFESHWAE